MGTRTPPPAHAKSMLGKRDFNTSVGDHKTTDSPNKRLKQGEDLSQGSEQELLQLQNATSSEESFLAPEQLDFSFFTKHMLGAKLEPHKLKHLSIAAMKGASGHLQKNKLSEKLGRRDVRFYDLHKLNSPAEDY